MVGGKASEEGELVVERWSRMGRWAVIQHERSLGAAAGDRPGVVGFVSAPELREHQLGIDPVCSSRRCWRAVGIVVFLLRAHRITWFSWAGFCLCFITLSLDQEPNFTPDFNIAV